jgi:hypothetical protein
MARTSKAGAGAQPSRNDADDKTIRCAATEGAQQCVSARHGPLQNHRWGKAGEGPQWHADGTPADGTAVTATVPLPAVPEGFGHDESGTDPDTGEYHPAARSIVDPPPGSHHADTFNGEAERKAAEHRAEIVASVTPEDRADMARIRRERTDAILPVNGQPRPVAVSGAPGSRLADVTSLVSTWTQLGFPVELQDELTQIQIAKLALDSMLEEIIRTRRPSDPALVASLLDAVDRIARARGLVRETGGGS